MAGTFITDLGPDARGLIEQVAGRRRYPARSWIFHKGEAGTGVFIVESGLVRIDRTTRGGKVVLLNLESAGALIGELPVIDGKSRSASMSTVTESTMLFIRTDDFERLVRTNERIRQAVMLRLARRVRSLSTQFLQNATLDAPARVAGRLLRLVEIQESVGDLTVDADGVIDLRLPISQEEIGQWAGLAREGTVKGLSTLKSIDLIRTGRMRVWIHDRDALADLAESSTFD